ncbi:hypothetical protein BKA67DRAFT_523912 [Truncatella angustata]|uniref:CNNM transmembrane domain-containing protein n=1 Tax=Truncatella angustata TaxID=152316 RepID=A0A9P8UCI6_9PEZI|nr:uncharacterized protein BKA67DRAFT_523912 [Truncatella angustata]KAH6647494.1 hypothetical protein BKA67DRAFT_523912 [Truncatella angustata]
MPQTRQTNHVLRTLRPAVLALGRVLALGYSAVTAAPTSIRTRDLHDDEPEAEGSALWVLYIVSMVLVLLGGAFAGLTIALMGQDSIYLQVIAQDREEPQRKNAKRVYDLLQKGKHWVLVTLLLSNVIVNETLPVVLDRCFGGGVAAVVGSTVLIVIFGEVLPQSVCVRYGLQIGGYMSKPVLCLMWAMFPVAWPTAKLLDWLLGEDHGTVYKKSGLKTLVTLHQSLGEVNERLNEDEVTIISAVLDLKRKPVEEVMTPMEDVLILSEETILDEEITALVSEAGFSRIPIHKAGNRRDFVGMLLVKMLITYDPEDAKRVRDFALAALPETRPETSCLDILNFFQEGKSHMVLISENPGEDYGALGVVTLEDVIEELIGEEIIDESDVYVDVHKAIRRTHPAPKARVQRKDVMVKDAAIKDGKLVDLDEDDDEESQRLRLSRTASATGRNQSPSILSSSPRTTLLMRRSSTGQDGKLVRTTVPVKANFEQMRGHLKHLGPSNPASNPKSTKVSTVKIKPGGGTQTRSGSVATEVHDADGANERTSLLRPPPNGNEGSNGHVPSYTSPLQNATRAEPETPKLLITPISDGKGEETSAQIKPALSSGSLDGPSKSTASSLANTGVSGAERQRVKRGYVRSGSITEIEVNTGGVRKFVLEATSSSDDENGDSNESSPISSSRPLEDVQEDDRSDDTVGPENTEQNNGPSSQGQSKKKNRRKKRKGGK